MPERQKKRRSQWARERRHSIVQKWTSQMCISEAYVKEDDWWIFFLHYLSIVRCIFFPDLIYLSQRTIDICLHNTGHVLCVYIVHINLLTCVFSAEMHTHTHINSLHSHLWNLTDKLKNLLTVNYNYMEFKEWDEAGWYFSFSSPIKVPAGPFPNIIYLYFSSSHLPAKAFVLYNTDPVWIYVFILKLQIQPCMRWMESVIDCCNRMMFQCCGCSEGIY